MQVLVFVTDDGKSVEGSGPTLVLLDAPTAVLPPNPRAMQWRYFATMRSGDSLFSAEAARMQSALTNGTPFVTDRLIK